MIEEWTKLLERISPQHRSELVLFYEVVIKTIRGALNSEPIKFHSKIFETTMPKCCAHLFANND